MTLSKNALRKMQRYTHELPPARDSRQEAEAARATRYYDTVEAELNCEANPSKGTPCGEALVKARINRSMMDGADDHPDGGKFEPDFHGRIARGSRKEGSVMGEMRKVSVHGNLLCSRPALKEVKASVSEEETQNARALWHLAKRVVGV